MWHHIAIIIWSRIFFHSKLFYLEELTKKNLRRTPTGSARYETGGEDDYGYVAQVDGQQADRQHGDDVYAAARARSDAPQPAYPGGPLPGEEAAIDGDLEYGTGYRSAGG